MGANSFAVVLILIDYLTVDPTVAYLPNAANNYCLGSGTFRNPSDPDCSSFYRCLGELFQPILEFCPYGFRYSERTKSCTWMSDVPCNNADDDHDPLSKLCTSENQKIYHPDNNREICNKYLVCRRNTTGAFEISSRDGICPPGDIFNPILGDCDSEDSFYCDFEDGPDCDNSLYDGRLLPIKDDCASYYKCTGGVRIKMKCANPNYRFDVLSQSCVYRRPEDCQQNSVTAPETESDVSSICHGDAGSLLADPNNCLGYYFCMNDRTAMWYDCDGLYFHNGSCTENRPSTCSCEDVAWEESDSPKRRVYEEHPNTSKYYVCSKGERPIIKTCPDEYVFELMEKSCVAKRGRGF